MAVKKETKEETKKETKEETKKETKKETEEKAPKQEEGYFVYVGKKGVMAYVLAVITQFSEGAKKVSIKARGKSISRAVDVAEIVRGKSPEVKIESINANEVAVTVRVSWTKGVVTREFKVKTLLFNWI